MPTKYLSASDIAPGNEHFITAVENDARFLLAVADYLDADDSETDACIDEMWSRYILCEDRPNPDHFVSSVMDGILYHSIGLIGYCCLHDDRQMYDSV